LSDGREISESVRYLPDKKHKILAASQTVAAAQIAPKIRLGQSPTFFSQYSKFHPNRFTIGGIIAESVKAVFLDHRVFA